MGVGRARVVVCLGFCFGCLPFDVNRTTLLLRSHLFETWSEVSLGAGVWGVGWVGRSVLLKCCK